jgi:arylsulfatase A-like enzyme
MQPKFLMIGLDGFRPDFLSPELTPNILRLAARGVRFASHRSAFPSETRVNLISIATGSYPQRHGIVANRYYDPQVLADRWFDTALYAHLLAGEAQSPGGLVGATSLGEVLAQHGRCMAVIATGSEGSSRMKHHKADLLPHFSFSCHYPALSRPVAATQEVIRRLGPPPPYRVPEHATVTYATDVFLHYAWPELQPDLTILWLVEPDTAYHYKGLQHTETDQAVATVDRQVGRILDWWESHPEVQLLVVSDHGHVRQRHKVSVLQELSAATGLNIAEQPGSDADAVLDASYLCALSVRDRRSDVAHRLARALQAQPWLGALLARRDLEISGALAQDLALVDHPRAPDLFFTLRNEEAADDGGRPGICWYDGDLAEGAGNHGGLNPRELASLGIAAGSLFRQDLVSTVPSGVVDWAPTMLAGLGLPRPASMQGRVLREALQDGGSPGAVEEESFTAAAGRYRQELKRWRVGGTTYLQGAWRR